MAKAGLEKSKENVSKNVDNNEAISMFEQMDACEMDLESKRV